MLPQYRIEHLIGRGGMGSVYKGVQLNLDRPVAIKLLPVEMAADKDFVARFGREARTLAKLQHPRIVTIHDVGQTTEGNLYFVMEYIDGTNLREILRGPGLDVDQVLAVVGQLCDALQEAHRLGIVHRDIKPENVLVTKAGYIKLADFGLARPVAEGTDFVTSIPAVLGTPAYMAPEQYGGEADQRSDIYALGVMLYEMLTGKRPHGAFDLPSAKVQVDVRIDQVVLRALQSEPERRYQEAGDMKTDVDRIRSTPPPAPPPPVAPPQSAAPARSPNRWPIYAAVAGILLGALGGYFWLSTAHHSTASAPPTSEPTPAPARPNPTPAPASPVAKTTAADRVWAMSVGLKTPASPPPVSTPPINTPMPANNSPAPSGNATTTAQRDAILTALLSYVWTWKPIGSVSFPWSEITFWKDGTITTSTSAKARWNITGPHSVALQFDNGDHIDLTFHFEFDYFTGARTSGSEIVNGWKKTDGHAPTTPAPAAQPKETVPNVASDVSKAPEISLFNGRDLSGWDGLSGFWRVQDGAITGQITKDHLPPGNTFLVWKGGEIADFEFKCRYRLISNNPGGTANSGIQFRARSTNGSPYDIKGYQGEMDPGVNHPAKWTSMPNINGCLTEDPPGILLAATGQKVILHSPSEGGRIDFVGSLGTAVSSATSFRKGDWNDYRIVAVGNHLQIFVNGIQTVDATDEGNRYRSGFLGLQLHKGSGPNTVQFKDLTLRMAPRPGNSASAVGQSQIAPPATLNAGSQAQPIVAPDPSAAIQPQSVWRGEGGHCLTILERKGNTFRGRFDIGSAISREMTGTVMGRSIIWLARDVHPIRGNPGDDNFGTITGDRIDFVWGPPPDRSSHTYSLFRASGPTAR